MKIKYLIAILFLSVSSVVWGDRTQDHEEARTLRLKGEIMPLRNILKVAEQAGLDTILEVELEKETGQWYYEIEGLSESNQFLELKIDASTGNVIEKEAKKKRHRKHH